MSAGWKTLGQCVASLASGCVVGLGFAPTNLWWLVVPGIASFLVIVIQQRPGWGFLHGFLFGYGMALIAFRWSGVLGIGVLLVFAAEIALWYGLVGLVVAAFRKTSVWGLLGVATWMSIEWISARVPFGGFGWGRLAYTAVETPLDGFFPLISATGVSFIIISTAFLLVGVVRAVVDGQGKIHRSRFLVVLPAGATAVGLIVSMAGYFLGVYYDPPADQGEVRVGVVQGNVPGMGMHAIGPAYTVDNNHLSETIILAAKVRTGLAPHPDFVLWPENSTATDPSIYPRTAEIISSAIDITGAPLLMGTISQGPGVDERQTTALWWTTSHEVDATYHKRNLVPFGEWVPWKSFFVALVPDLEYVGAQSVPGTSVGVLDVALGEQPQRVGVIICFELAYDSTFDDVIKGDATIDGAQVITIQTSNAMFTGTTQMAQQDRITRVRAMESRREILIATTNSLAGLVDSHGHVVYASQLRTSDSQVFTVPLRTHITPAVAYRPWFDLGTILLPLLGAGVLATAHRPRSQMAKEVSHGGELF